MGYINSKRFDGVQLYQKSNKDVSYYIRFKSENGKLKRIKVGDKSKGINEAYCFQKRNELINKMRLGEDDRLFKNKFCLNDAFDPYIEWAKVNKVTWRKNDFLIYNKHLKDTYGNRPLVTLKSRDFEELKQQKMKQGYKSRTIYHLLGLARRVINYAINNELISNYTNPIAGGRVKMPKVDNAKRGYLTREQAKLLLDNLKSRDHRLAYNLTMFLLCTGGRFGEVSSLKWYDINFENRLIFFNTAKDGNPRHIYIVDELLELLIELKENSKSPSDYVIPSTIDTRVTQMPRQWQLIVDELIPNNKKAGKYRITTHSLRHTHASWLAISGVNIMVIKEQLGHKKLDMTLRYSHLIPSQRHEQTNDVFNVI